MKSLLPACAALWLMACSEPGSTPPDATPRPDASVLFIDAGPKTYERVEDFPREGCDDSGAIGGVPYLGKWHNVPTGGTDEFDSYFVIEDEVLKGILDSIPADRLLVDDDNLYLHRRYNLSSLAVNLCAVIGDNTLFGHMASCNGSVCSLDTLEATLVEPMTQ